jgi:signal transduction histidine kinase
MNAGAIAQDRQIEFNVELADGLPDVWVDAKALREVLNNLLDNALKYTPSGGQVWVWVGDRQLINSADSSALDGSPPPTDTPASGTHQAIAIADNGPGIPTEDLTHVFERHYRGVQSQTDIPGTGLGLAIANDLIRHMNGRIDVFSPLSTWPSAQSTYPDLAERVARGTVFVVWLQEAHAQDTE